MVVVCNKTTKFTVSLAPCLLYRLIEHTEEIKKSIFSKQAGKNK